MITLPAIISIGMISPIEIIAGRIIVMLHMWKNICAVIVIDKGYQ